MFLLKAFTEMAALKPDVWIHCGNMKSGVYGILLLDNLGFRPKATLQTVAPNSLQTFMGFVGNLGHYVLAVGQWHPEMTFRDSFYGVRGWSSVVRLMESLLHTYYAVMEISILCDDFSYYPIEFQSNSIRIIKCFRNSTLTYVRARQTWLVCWPCSSAFIPQIEVYTCHRDCPITSYHVQFNSMIIWS